MMLVDTVIKSLEIRDKATFIPALAIQVSGGDGYLFRRAGFDRPIVYLIHLISERCAFDPFTWADRTMTTAHQYIEKEFDSLSDGDVIDVEFILGESSVKKLSEREEEL